MVALLAAIAVGCFGGIQKAQGQGQTAMVPAFPNMSPFSRPMDLELAPNGDRFVVGQQFGLVYDFEADPEVSHRRVILSLEDSVFGAGGEGGLQSIAYDPNFEKSPYLYVYYMTGDPAKPTTTRRTRVSRFEVDGAGMADPLSEVVLIEMWQPAGNHNGGKILFGPDDYLYIPLGDGSLDTRENGQDRTTLLGSVLRIDPHGTTHGAYGIPPDNPFVGNTEGWREEIWAWGFRNPWRSWFDPDGNLWIGDVGEVSWEELDIVRAGENHGWAIYEGYSCFTPPCDPEGLTFPIHVYPHDVATAGFSITGGQIYQGTFNTKYQGWYTFADAVTNRVWALNPNNPSEVDELLHAGGSPTLVDFCESPAGELLVVGYVSGVIYDVMESVAVSTEPTDVHHNVLDLAIRPNPAVQEMVVVLHTSETGHASVFIYDVLGRRVASIFEGPVANGRMISTVFETANLPSGTYLIRATVNDASVTESVTILD
ncbi:MAG: PQQ-dependent sugar dehydrogenase [Rubricoccaceae bacterium]|nr:PQQ-dependent sugar dehydrogenase [Rubricoccaceae bacterium]